jgi:hypothetical protein
MLRGSPARSDRGAGGSRTGSILELLAGIRGGARIAVAVGLLTCFGGDELWAQAVPQKLIVHRSTRAIPHRFTVHPNEATIAVNQTQRFEVTDAQGRHVAVHWNVSGIGCSGLACGTIDDGGNYRTPPSLPQPHVVTVEAVLVSDPNYSVLTQVRLEDSVTATVNATPGQVAPGKTQPFTAPEVGRQSLAKNAGLFPPLPNAVAAAPVVGRQLASNAGLPPLPNVVAAAPAVGRQLAPSADLPPLPTVVAAAPVVGRQNLATSAGSPPLPNAVAAAPVLGRQNLAISVGSPPLPNAVAAAPVLGRQNLAISVGSPPLPNPVGAAPAVGRQLASSAQLPPLPNPVGAAPVVERRNLASTASESSPQLPNVVAAVSPAAAQVSTGKTQRLAATGVARQKVGASGVLMPMPDVVAPVPGGTVISTQHGPVVTYRDGQLTIDAENATLAAVLELVAEKTGAVIDVPPGSGLERIFEHSGPKPANEVLEQLLNGSPFNFIIVASPQNPNQPAQVLLSLHGPDTEAPTVASVQPKTATNPLLFTPPEGGPLTPAVLPYALDSRNLQPPKEKLSPEVIEQMMKNYTRQLHGEPPQ